MGIEDDKAKILQSLSTQKQFEGDSQEGRYMVPAEELMRLTSMTIEQLDDAVEILRQEGLVEIVRITKSMPFESVALTPRGRQKAEDVDVHGRRELSRGPQTGKEFDRTLGIPTKDAFSDDLRLVIAKGKPKSQPVSVVIFDLDDFKHVNDGYGHDVGDLVLKRMSQTIQTVADGRGSCYRWGGDEFTIILPNYTASEAVPLAERILSELSVAAVEGYTESINASAGVAEADFAIEDVEQVFKDADGALRKAKANGKTQVGVAVRRSGTGVASGGETKTASITSRVQSVDVCVKLEYIDRGQYLIHIRNKSDKEDVTILAIGVSTDDGIELMSDVTPQQAGLWKLRPNQEVPISFRPDRDPAAQLWALPHNMTREERLVGRDPVTAKLAVKMRSEICGLPKDLRKIIVVRVNPDMRLTQVAG